MAFSFQLFYPAAGLPQLLLTPTAAVALTDLKWGVLRIPSLAPLSACLHYTHRGESAGSKQQAEAAHSWRQVLWGIITVSFMPILLRENDSSEFGAVVRGGLDVHGVKLYVSLAMHPCFVAHSRCLSHCCS